MNGPVKIGVVGGSRGTHFDHTFQAFPDKVALTAICDTSDEVLSAWGAEHPGVQTFAQLEDLLEKGDCDAVVIATPMLLHARQSIEALGAGKHVLSSVAAAVTLDECWELVETVEKTGLTYMLDESFCYYRSNMMVKNMVEQGVFGAITYAEGAYIDNCSYAAFKRDGTLGWRGEIFRDFRANWYPTHQIGPVAQWLRINRPGGDRLVSTATWGTGSVGISSYAESNFGPDHPASKPGFFSTPDVALTLVRTEKGVLIVIKTDTGSPRPDHAPSYDGTEFYALQGTAASYLSIHPEEPDPLVWIEGRSPTHTGGGIWSTGPVPSEWQSLWSYADEYEHPYWREWGDAARGARHRGADFFPMMDFADAVLTGQPSPIDVYDAATWSSLVPLSMESWQKGGAPVDVPDFTRGRTVQ